LCEHTEAERPSRPGHSRQHEAELPNSRKTAEQVAALIELIKAPPAGEEQFLLTLLSERVPPGVDEAAYVKAGFLSAIAKGETELPADQPRGRREAAGQHARRLQHRDAGRPAADDASAPSPPRTQAHAADVRGLPRRGGAGERGNAHAKAVMQSWADGEWFTNRPEVPEIDQGGGVQGHRRDQHGRPLPAPDAWSPPGHPLHALAMYKMTRDGLTPRNTA
jgi:aconitate hydratase 2/2-methylisocitrate dehydratase